MAKRGIKDDFNPVQAPAFPNNTTRLRPDGTTGFAVYDQWESGDRSLPNWRHGRVTRKYRNGYDRIKWQ
jgi:hypothetical protein